MCIQLTQVFEKEEFNRTSNISVFNTMFSRLIEWMNNFIDLYILYIVSYNQIICKMSHVIQSLSPSVCLSVCLSLSLSLSLSNTPSFSLSPSLSLSSSLSFFVPPRSLSKLQHVCLFDLFPRIKLYKVISLSRTNMLYLNPYLLTEL